MGKRATTLCVRSEGKKRSFFYFLRQRKSQTVYCKYSLESLSAPTDVRSLLPPPSLRAGGGLLLVRRGTRALASSSSVPPSVEESASAPSAYSSIMEGQKTEKVGEGDGGVAAAAGPEGGQRNGVVSVSSSSVSPPVPGRHSEGGFSLRSSFGGERGKRSRRRGWSVCRVQLEPGRNYNSENIGMCEDSYLLYANTTNGLCARNV